MFFRTKSWPINILSAAIALLPGAKTAAQGLVLEEVLVTAQKRTQSLQDVPLSVSAVSGTKIRESNIRNLVDLSLYVPNFSVNSDAITDFISIRGIQAGVTQSLEQPVGTFVDGIYRGRGIQTRFSFMDAESVEVLRGPQGTLFGKNTIAGAINITSAAPTSEFSAEVTGLYEFEHEQKEIRGFVSGPLADSLAGRLSLLLTRQDGGWIDSNYPSYPSEAPELDEYAVRAQLQWDASEKLQFRFKAEQSERDNTGNSDELVVNELISDGVPVWSGLGEQVDVKARNQRSTMGNNSSAIDYGAQQLIDADFQEYLLRADYLMQDVTLTALAGYSEYDVFRFTDADFTAIDGIGLDDQEDFRQTSLELRAVSTTDKRLSYILGLYYQDNELESLTSTRFNLSPDDPDSYAEVAVQLAVDIIDPSGSNPIAELIARSLIAAEDQFNRTNLLDQDTETLAVFAQFDYQLRPDLQLTLGMRYGEEEKTAVQAAYCSAFDLQEPDPNQCTFLAYQLAEFENHELDLKREEEDFTFSINLAWDMSDDVMAYGRYANGVKSGGFNNFALRDDEDEAEFEEETVDTLEFGIKSVMWNNRVNLNTAVFYTEYDDLQVVQFTGQTGFIVENAARADIYGLELDGRILATEALTIFGSLGYVDFEFDDYDTAACTDLQNQAFLAAGGDPPCYQDLSGQATPFTAEWTASLSLDYNISIGREHYLRAVAEVNWIDGHDTTPDNDPLVYQDSYALWNAMIHFGNIGDDWQLSLVGRNLGDEEYIVYSNDIPLLSGNHQGNFGRGASYSIVGTYRF